MSEADFVLDAPATGAEWGPSGELLPETFQKIPYTPFSSTTRLGRVADLSGLGRGHRHAAPSSSASAFNFTRVDDSSFTSAAAAKKAPTRGGRTVVAKRVFTVRPTNAKANNDLQKKRRGADRQVRGRRQKLRINAIVRRNYSPQKQVVREASVEVAPEWELVEEIKFKNLSSSVSLDAVPEGETLYECGIMDEYDTTIEDSAEPAAPVPLKRSDRVFYRVSTTTDPMMQKLAKEHPECNVFGFDLLVSHLMVAPSSLQSWDVTVRRVGERQIFFDLSQDNGLYAPPVNETSLDNPEERDAVNAPHRLNAEAAYVDMMFSQQCLTKDKRHPLANPDPFNPRRAEAGELAALGYQYRRFHLSADNVMLVRCAVTARVPPPLGSDSTEAVPGKSIALTEIDISGKKKSSGKDWKHALLGNQGAVLVTEIKNNTRRITAASCAVALADCQVVKLAYVSRVKPKDPTHHEILAVRSYRRNEFLRQTNVRLQWAFGVLNEIVETVADLDEGTYRLLKDPLKPLVSVYRTG